MRTLRAIAVCLALVFLGTLARAEPPDPFLRLAQEYRPEERHRLPEIRERLLREEPDFFLRPLPRCPLRSALARLQTPDEARAWLERSAHDPDTLAVVVGNLAARTDLAALVLGAGTYERLEPGHARLLSEVAMNALLDGDDRLVRKLLLGPGWWRAADALSRLPHPEGLQALADVVTGAIPVPAAARARLALFEPDVQNARPVRPLGEARVRALVDTASHDPDPAIRALAARMLLRANDPAHAMDAVRAFVESRTVLLESVDWHHLAKLAPVPTTDPRVSIEDRLDMLEGWLVWNWVRAESDPLDAEAQAAALRPVLAAAGERYRGEAILVLMDHLGIFVTTTQGRKRAVPSFLAILDDLEATAPADSPTLASLAREAAGRMRAEIAEEEGYPKVRIADQVLAAEDAWRPCGRAVDTDLAGVTDGVDSPERFASALARVEDAALPPDSRLRVFEHLLSFALDGEPDEEEAPFDRRCLDQLLAWIVERTPSLDGGLPEAILGAILDAYVPEDHEALVWERVANAVKRLPQGGPRLRLETLLSDSSPHR